MAAPTDSSQQDENRAPRNARARWLADYQEQVPRDHVIRNRSGLEVRPLYTADERPAGSAREPLGYPGQYPFTRGIYASMHRGRTWTQRQLIGLGTPRDYNDRVRALLGAGANAISLLPCNSAFRGLDCDQAPPQLLGTCGTVINTADHMDTCLDGVPIERISTAMNDPSPFTLMAFLLVVARRRGLAYDTVTGTSNQSDYLSHFVANHMFYRLSLDGSRRVLVDHVAFCSEHVPRWNPLSVVGQHMQQAGATPVDTIAFTFAAALQHVEDCMAGGLGPDQILARTTFFFDISISFFEEIAKFRAARRLWARLTRERLGAKDPRSWRFKFHGQTSGVDLTTRQPLNNIARVATQAIAGILSGLQSMHTDAYDEAITCPTAETARIAVATQNILREEAHLCDVIDPLGGSYYIETLTDQMEEMILDVMGKIEELGGMRAAVECGWVQRRIGQSALAHQDAVGSGEEKVVGVNCYTGPEDETDPPPPYRPDPDAIAQQVTAFRRFKQQRSGAAVERALANLAHAANHREENIFASVIEAAEARTTHGEIVACLRDELGPGEPLIVA